jgi:hypothetical protein
MPKGEASEGWTTASSRHLVGPVTPFFGHFLKVWDEERCNNDLALIYGYWALVSKEYERNKETMFIWDILYEILPLRMVPIYQTTRCYTLQSCNVSLQFRENIKSSMLVKLTVLERKTDVKFHFQNISYIWRGEKYLVVPNILHAAGNTLGVRRGWDISCKNETLNISDRERWRYICENFLHIPAIGWLLFLTGRLLQVTIDRQTDTFPEEGI